MCIVVVVGVIDADRRQLSALQQFNKSTMSNEESC